MLSLIIAAAVVAVLFHYFIIKPYHYWKDRGVKQGKPIWILGDNWGTISRLQNFTEMLEYVYNQCPGTRYSGMYQFFLPTLVVKDPDLLKQLTVKDFDHFTDHRGFFPIDSDDLLAQNLFLHKGQKWRDMRTILSPSFTSSKMRAMFVLMTECSENFVQHFLKKDKDVIQLDTKDTFSRFTNDVIATTAFGVKVDSLDEPNNEFYVMGKETVDFTGFWKNLKFFVSILCPKLFHAFKLSIFGRKLNDFFVELVDKTIKAREEQGIVRPDMIHLLMEARKGNDKYEEEDVIDTGFSTAQESNIVKSKVSKELTNLDIAAQSLLFFLAGFDTTSNLMSFMSYELAVNPEVQENLRKEVLATQERCGEKLTYESLLQMKYMDMVVSETLRKWPSAVITDRECVKPYTIEPVNSEEKPLHLDKGVLLWLPIYAIHRDPKHFPDPERFDPERFSEENKGNIKPYTYFPFGLGPRNCIGSRFALLETKTVFFYILSHFELIPTDRTPIPLKLTRKSLTFAPEGGIWIGLKRIKS